MITLTGKSCMRQSRVKPTHLVKGGNGMIIKNRNKKTNLLYSKVYSLWYNMMYRCYNPKSSNYKCYGKLGITVDKRWHTFDNFVEDIDKIRGFNLELFLDGKLTLDKDMFKRGNTIYCLEFCSFISRAENNKHKPHQQKEVIGISQDGKRYEFTNQSEFARLHGLRQSTIGDCLGGKVKKHKGWRFYYKKDELEDQQTNESIA